MARSLGSQKVLRRGQYAFWLGSGISRDRVDDLKGVIARVLTHLRDRIDAGNANCVYRTALLEALDLRSSIAC